MKILMTGATGFLGSKLALSLASNGKQLVLLTRSTSSLTRIAPIVNHVAVYHLDVTPLEDIFANNQFDTIIHCATNYGRGVTDRLAILEANLMLPLRLLQLASLFSVRCFINTDTILDKLINPYSMAKSHFLDWLITFQSSLVCINVALEHFFGAGDDPTKFVSYIVHQLLQGAKQIELTPGEQERDFIYVDDVVSAFQKILTTHGTEQAGYHAYQIGTGNSISIRSFVELIQAVSGTFDTHLAFGALPYREHEVMKISVDTTALRNIGWQPERSHFDALLEMITEERRANR